MKHCWHYDKKREQICCYCGTKRWLLVSDPRHGPYGPKIVTQTTDDCREHSLHKSLNIGA